MNIQRYSIHHSGKRCERSETGEFVDWEDHCESVRELQSEIDRLTRELDEAKARAVIPDGWVAMPVEPTEEMELAAEVSRPRGYRDLYRAMHSARPELPKEPSDAE